MKNKTYETTKSCLKKTIYMLSLLAAVGCSQGTDFKDTGGTQQGQGVKEPVNGQCGTQKNVCVAGELFDAADSDTQFLWACNGKNGGRNVSCKMTKPVNAACGPTENTCLSGTMVDSADTTTQFRWSCNGTNDGTNATCTLAKPPPPPEPIDEMCVQVFYDTSVDQFKLGRTYALMVINLLGHFPEYQKVVGPIELYRKGDIARCHATFYVGMEYDNPLPTAFLEDFKTATKQVIWMGYNFWQLGDGFTKDFGYSTYEMTTLDYNNRTPAPDNKPSFFRDILYKGEVFPKYNVWADANKTVLDAPFEMAKLTGKVSGDVSEVIGQAKHSKTGEIIPWALKNKNKFWISEVPVSFAHEADRYYVFADLMFDFLNTPPKSNEKLAFIRLEDIGPNTDINWLEEAMGIFKKYQVPTQINLFPIFNDPLYAIGGHANKPMIRMENDPTFNALMTKYQSEGNTFIWHGVTHQYNAVKNPWTGASGDDYEFWNANTLAPIAEDSVSYVLNKMEDGYSSLKKFNIHPKVWVTPHYEASALDNVIFGQIFPWMVSRGVYFDLQISGLGSQDPTTATTYFDAANTNGAQNRKDFLANLQVKVDSSVPRFGQLFPYEIYGDIYRQRILPEDLGNVESVLSEQVEFVRTADMMLADAKRNLVLRDFWASGFYHPYQLDPSLNPVNKDKTKPKDLERLIKGIKDMGYKFINVDEYAASHTAPVGKPHIDLLVTRGTP